MNQTDMLANLDKASELIEKAKSLDEAFVFKAIINAALIDDIRRGFSDRTKQLVEYKYKVESRIGEILVLMKENGKRAPQGGRHSNLATLQGMKISESMSSRCQKFYRLPEEEKNQIINHAIRRIERRQYIEKEKNASDIPKDWLVNKSLRIPERIANYQSRFPNVPQMMRNCDGEYTRIDGMWELGIASMKQGEYYGAYPPTYLERILSFFPDCTTVIHIFSGTIEANPPRVITYDINPKFNPTICDDVSNIKKYKEYFHRPNLLVMLDPYYEDKDFQKQNQKPINKKKLLDDLCEIVPRGTFVAWLDVVSLVWSAQIWKEIGLIGVKVSSNTRYRGTQIFQRL